MIITKAHSKAYGITKPHNVCYNHKELDEFLGGIHQRHQTSDKFTLTLNADGWSFVHKGQQDGVGLVLGEHQELIDLIAEYVKKHGE